MAFQAKFCQLLYFCYTFGEFRGQPWKAHQSSATAAQVSLLLSQGALQTRTWISRHPIQSQRMRAQTTKAAAEGAMLQAQNMRSSTTLTGTHDAWCACMRNKRPYFRREQEHIHLRGARSQTGTQTPAHTNTHTSNGMLEYSQGFAGHAADETLGSHTRLIYEHPLQYVCLFVMLESCVRSSNIACAIRYEQSSHGVFQSSPCFNNAPHTLRGTSPPPKAARSLAFGAAATLSEPLLGTETSKSIIER